MALLAPTAQAQQAGITGDVPAKGGVALVQWGGGPVDELQAAPADEGCDLTSTWVTSDGAFIDYVVGAPDFVNATFIAAVGAEIPAGGHRPRAPGGHPRGGARLCRMSRRPSTP
jgi:hypothetical protein